MITGVLWNHAWKTGTAVTLYGQASIAGLEVGGGPMPGGPPLGIWGGGGVGNYPDAGFPGPQPGQPPRPWGPINYPDQGLPGNQPIAGWGPGFPTNPIAGIPGLPGYMPPLPPGTEQPQPGDPTTPLPPPSGSSGWPVQPITPPPYIVVQYPGIGPVIVAPPESSKTT